MRQLKIEYLETDNLIPYINNPRINGNAVDAVAGSIAEFGFRNPIIIDKDNVIIAGHTRLLAAKKLGLTEVPVVRADDLTEAQVKAYRIADNKTAEFAEWDTDRLIAELQDIGDLFTGFEAVEIEDIMGKIEPPPRATPFEYETDFHLEPEIVEELQNGEVFITFSGGKDSSVAAFLMIPILRKMGKPFELVYVDTGVELPSVAEYVIRFAEHFGCDLQVVRNGIDFFSYYEPKKQWPNAIYRDCIGVLIKDPAERYMIEKAGEGKEIINVRGGRSVQATDLSKGQKFYTVKQGTKDIQLLSPLYNLSEDAFERYKGQLDDEFGLWEGYAKGFQRTACWCCPFQTVQQYDMIKKELPLCWGVLERKAKEWKFQGSTHLDRYLNRPRRGQKASED